MRLDTETPSLVLVWLPDDDFRGEIVEQLADTDCRTVVTDSVSDARGRIDSPDAAAVVLGSTGPGVVDLVADAQGCTPAVPVLFCPDDADDSTIADVAAAGGRYVPRAAVTSSTDVGSSEQSQATDACDGATASRLVETTREMVESYRERRLRAEDSDILGTILSDLEVRIYAKDEAGRHVRVADVPGNPAPSKMLGTTDLEVFDDDTPSDQDQESLGEGSDPYRDDMRVIETGEAIRDKQEQFGEPPVDDWSRTTKVPWTDNEGSVRGLVGISVDITELKSKERALERQNDRLERFSRYVSHDLKNPLQVARGYLDVARDGVDGDPDRSLAKVDNALGRIEEMLEDLGETVRQRPSDDVESADVQFVALADLFTDVWSAMDAETATLDVAVDDAVTVAAADSEIRPLVENLLKNAVEHGNEGVTVTVGLLPDGFYVADDGPGIPEAERERVTEEGYTTADSGTGTGLALVSDIATEQGWELAVTESAAGGARFAFRNAMVAGDGPVAHATLSTHDLDESADVGFVEAGDRGSYDPDRDRWTVESDGTDIWRDENGFHFVFTRVTGDVRIQGRLAAFDPPADFSKAGLMIRGSTDEDAAYGHIGATGNFGSEVLWRGEPGEAGVSHQPERGSNPFEWYRVERVGDRVACAVSDDGTTWQTVDERPVDLGDSICVGLAVCSVKRREPATAAFEDVTVTDLETPE